MAKQRSHIPNNRQNSHPEIMTRVQQDLSTSPHQGSSGADQGDSEMLRRLIGKVPHVCVVGAGVTGLRCADVLLQHGVKVTILEARNRIGGRVRSKPQLRDF